MYKICIFENTHKYNGFLTCLSFVTSILIKLRSKSSTYIRTQNHQTTYGIYGFYKQTVIWAKTNVARTLVLETSAKIMLLWPLNGDATDLRFRATAIICWPMSITPTKY